MQSLCKLVSRTLEFKPMWNARRKIYRLFNKFSIAFMTALIVRTNIYIQKCIHNFVNHRSSQYMFKDNNFRNIQGDVKWFFSQNI